MTTEPVIAAIDAGGTSFKCALVGKDGTLIATWRVPTTTPSETLDICAASFREQAQKHKVDPIALGIASFGPVDTDPKSPSFGKITGTAKPGWNSVPIGPHLSDAIGVPFYLDTDVNAALLAELRWGSAKSLNSAAYMTVGTGIGVGICVNGGLVGQPTHPEFGHIRVARHLSDQAFAGTCALHGDCLEGLASAKSFEARWGDAAVVPADHQAWEIEAHYLAQACLNLYMMTRLERIILGGGLLQADHLYTKVAAAFDTLMGDYLPVSGAELITAPGLGEHVGVLGGAVLALEAFN
ncbi:MAG: ROK family protein [Henriciella sp.]